MSAFLVEYIYDCNLAMKDVNGHSPRFTDLVNGEKIDAELYIRRIPLANASPRDEKLCTQFLHKLYKEKVERLNYISLFSCI